MRVIKAILTILLLVTVLTIPKTILWFLSGLIRVLIVIQKTLTYLIKLLNEEVTGSRNEKTTNS